MVQAEVRLPVECTLAIRRPGLQGERKKIIGVMIEEGELIKDEIGERDCFHEPVRMRTDLERCGYARKGMACREDYVALGCPFPPIARNAPRREKDYSVDFPDNPFDDDVFLDRLWEVLKQ